MNDKAMKKRRPEIKWMIAAGIIGALAIAAGAFGAHGMEGKVSARAISALDTGSNYALLHAIALLGVAALYEKSPRFLEPAAWAFVIGIFLFSGSLIVFGLTDTTAHLWITPLGGLAFMVGWGIVAWAGTRVTK